MRNCFVVFLFLLGFQWGSAQASDALAIEQTIVVFFEGFHTKDSVLLRSTLHETFDLGSVFKTPDGSKFQPMEGQEFIAAVIARADSPTWKEVLGEFEIKISGQLANAWVPYEFWLNDTFSHCGVNSIHLMETKQGWKILNITDSRLRNCD